MKLRVSVDVLSADLLKIKKTTRLARQTLQPIDLVLAITRPHQARDVVPRKRAFWGRFARLTKRHAGDLTWVGFGEAAMADNSVIAA